LNAEENKSAVARLRAQIDAQDEAAARCLSGLALGTAQHRFIAARMEHMAQCFTKFIEEVGQDAAMPIILQVMEATPTNFGASAETAPKPP